MDDINTDRTVNAPNLKNVLRKARLDEAERSDVVADLRGAEQARLEILAEALEPVLAQVPDAVDMFDTGVVPGERPRLFIDVIGFVEMGEDKRTYCFVQDTRHGRVKAGETARLEKMVDIVTEYIARRLMERERALASDLTIEQAALALLGRKGSVAKRDAKAPEKDVERSSVDDSDGQPAAQQSGSAADTKSPVAAVATMPQEKVSRLSHKDTSSDVERGKPSDVSERDAEQEQRPRRKLLSGLWDAIEFLALFVGFVVLLIALAGAVYFAWTMGEGLWVSKFLKAS